MYLLVAVIFSILYAAIVYIGTAMGVGSALYYIILASIVVGIQYLISPTLVGWIRQVELVSEKEEQRLQRIVAEPAEEAAHLPKTEAGILKLNIPVPPEY